MTDRIVTVLREGHRRAEALLDTLERQLAGIRDDDTPDYELMLQVLDYLVGEGRSGRLMALEDRVFAWTADNRPNLRLPVASLRRQHRHLHCRGRALADAVTQILDGQLVSRARLLRAGRRFVEAYRIHLRQEEARAFAPLDTGLSAADRRKLMAELSPELDTDDGFQDLLDRLVTQAAGYRPWTGGPDARCPVCSQA